ncbi:hypothetical protein KP509_36G005800 [Ceratopteris richardii]|uniref:protein-S-isoprenylcysteine alpha-carbonyl methylesterase n=1 Tax=Ceratopteris richardii TaxID=49495 RepID=A0A8T2QAS3_CERRI|nr:hypothetical protein KP509_36G005800 [Ceratopteris richardii]
MALGLVRHAINGAVAHLAATQGTWPKAKLGAALSYLFIKELVGMVVLLPSFSRSIIIYIYLPSHCSTPEQSITITKSSRLHLRFLHNRLPWVRVLNAAAVRNIPYGEAKRNLLDVYLPEACLSEKNEPDCPVVMFVHGGAWASGSKELFAHLGAYLAHFGVVTVLVQYSLFPQVMAWEQVREVSQALTWVLDNVKFYAGDPGKVTLMGHSAGAHLCALVMWERFKALQQLQGRKAAAKRDSPISALSSAEICEDLDEQDVRQPSNFIGLAGVYDIVEHLKYEQKRGVDRMSSMTPAMGGENVLEAMSPVHLFHSFKSGITSINGNKSHKLGDSSVSDSVLGNVNNCGLLCVTPDIASEIEMHPEVFKDADVGEGEDDHVSARLQKSMMRHKDLPTCTLLCSRSDKIVRPDSSISFHDVLVEQLGHQSELIVFENLAHGDFVDLDGCTPDHLSLRRCIMQVVQP